MMSIWQELVDRHHLTARYAAVQRFVHGLREALPPEARIVIATRPDEEAQVDYGQGPMVRYPVTGKYRRTRLFVLTLAQRTQAPPGRRAVALRGQDRAPRGVVSKLSPGQMRM